MRTSLPVRRSSWLFLAALTVTAACVYSGGCAALQNPDDTLAAAHAGATTAVTVGSLFGPIGAAVGTGIAGLILAWTAKKLGVAQGKEIGYNEGSADAGKPLPSAVPANGMKP
jgi:hypothetical protein